MPSYGAYKAISTGSCCCPEHGLLQTKCISMQGCHDLACMQLYCSVGCFISVNDRASEDTELMLVDYAELGKSE